jgi:hypothetical protein
VRAAPQFVNHFAAAPVKVVDFDKPLAAEPAEKSGGAAEKKPAKGGKHGDQGAAASPAAPAAAAAGAAAEGETKLG